MLKEFKKLSIVFDLRDKQVSFPEMQRLKATTLLIEG